MSTQAVSDRGTAKNFADKLAPSALVRYLPKAGCHDTDGQCARQVLRLDGHELADRAEADVGVAA